MSSISLVGPQILSEDMMDCAFHYRSDVLNTIENFRLNAAAVSENFAETLRKREQEAVMLSRGYNNTISILGSHGSGKTSIIMTLQKRLSEDGGQTSRDGAPRNIMMPILIPQDIEPEQKLLSCIISQLLKEAEEIEKKIQKTPRNVPNYAWSKWENSQQGEFPADPFQKCMYRLLSAFELRFHRGLTAQPADADQVYYYMDSVKRDAELLTDMLKLISMIVDYYRYQASIAAQDRPGSGVEPLLFFTIDDLDLAPHRSSEVLDLVLRYLTHPNVVVICGWNHELFQNPLCMDLLSTQGVLEKDLLNTNFSFDDVFMNRYRKRTTALDSARRLAVDNLKKAFPPAQRFEIRGLSTQERAEFPYGLFCADEKQKDSLFYWVEETMRQCVRFSDPNTADKLKTFLRDDYNDKLFVYMRIFDNKVRGLANTRRAFESLTLYLVKKQKEYMDGQAMHRRGKAGAVLDVTSQIKVLFDAILFSNTRFLPYRRGLRDLVQIKKVGLPCGGGRGALEYYCNFQGVQQTLEKYEQDRERNEALEAEADYLYNAEHALEQKYDYFPNLVVDVFLLLNFMENFLHTITQSKGSAHGGREFNAYLNTIHRPIHFPAGSGELLYQAIRVGGVQELKLFPDTSDFALSVSILNAYERDGFDETQYHFTGFLSLMRLFRMVDRLLSDNRKLNMDAVHKVLRADPVWLSTIMRLLDVLQPRDENIRRLAVFSSILESTRSDDEAIKQASLCDSWAWNRLEPFRQESLDFTDETLDILVQCLRMIDRSRSYFLQCKQRGTLGRSKKPNAEDQAALRRAHIYCRIAVERPRRNIWPGEDQDTIFIPDLKQLHRFLRMLSESKQSDPFDISENYVGTEDDMGVINEALDWADRDASFLLHDLKVRMRRALEFNYNMRSGNLEQQHQYLSQASVAVRKYIELWELIPGSWGRRELKAASELISIFQANLLEELVNDMLDIVELGPELGQMQRDRYSNKVGMLRQHVSSHSSYFTEEELERIRDNFNILSDAPKQIRRGLRIEGDIYDAIMEIGVMVAQEFGMVSCELFKDWAHNTSKRLSVWPVSASYDHELTSLAVRLDRLIPKKSVPRATMFDVQYSDIELYLQIAGE